MTKLLQQGGVARPIALKRTSTPQDSLVFPRLLALYKHRDALARTRFKAEDDVRQAIDGLVA